MGHIVELGSKAQMALEAQCRTIVYVDLVLCLELFGYKFALICDSVVLILNLISIIVIKKIFVKSMGLTRSMWVVLDIWNFFN